MLSLWYNLSFRWWSLEWRAVTLQLHRTKCSWVLHQLVMNCPWARRELDVSCSWTIRSSSWKAWHGAHWHASSRRVDDELTNSLRIVHDPVTKICRPTWHAVTAVLRTLQFTISLRTSTTRVPMRATESCKCQPGLNIVCIVQKVEGHCYELQERKKRNWQYFYQKTSTTKSWKEYRIIFPTYNCIEINREQLLSLMPISSTKYFSIG